MLPATSILNHRLTQVSFNLILTFPAFLRQKHKWFVYIIYLSIYLIPFVCDHWSEMGKLISSIDRADLGAISPSLIPGHNLNNMILK